MRPLQKSVDGISPSTDTSMWAILLIKLLLATGANGESMRVRDPYIVCPGTYVPDNAHGLPAGYSPSVYFNVMQLCSALNGYHRNVGCACSSANEGSFYCHPGVADANLFHAIVLPSRKRFTTFCAESCMCADLEIAAEARNRQANRQQSQGGGAQSDPESGENYFDPDDPSYHIMSTDESSGGENRQAPYDPAAGWEAGLNVSPVPSPVPSPVSVSHAQCWENCTSNADCSKGGEQGCMCATQKEQYQPGSGTVAFVAACIISMSGVGGKRQEANPCPCNATYVSHACCGIDDGLVWEEPRFKLGELVRS